MKSVDYYGVMKNGAVTVYAKVLLQDTMTGSCADTVGIRQSFSFTFVGSTANIDSPVLGNPGYLPGSNLRIGNIIYTNGLPTIDNTAPQSPFYIQGIMNDGSCATVTGDQTTVTKHSFELLSVYLSFPR